MYTGKFNAIAKRLLDVVLAIAALLLLWPLFVVVTIVIKVETRGPVVFKQLRGGRGGVPVGIYKFRTMNTINGALENSNTQKNDVRVTKFGRILRRLNIDELPQLFNVIRGEMSLVGPRPHVLAEDEFFSVHIQDYSARYRVRPGITGWAQVNGLRGPAEEIETMRRRLAFDLEYIEQQTLRLDLKIILWTLCSPKAFLNAY